MALEEKERDKVLKEIFQKTKKNQLILRTPKGVIIRVQRNITLMQKPLSVQKHEERISIDNNIQKKEKRVFDLYSKLKKFLRKSKEGK